MSGSRGMTAGLRVHAFISVFTSFSLVTLTLPKQPAGVSSGDAGAEAAPASDCLGSSFRPCLKRRV